MNPSQQSSPGTANAAKPAATTGPANQGTTPATPEGAGPVSKLKTLATVIADGEKALSGDGGPADAGDGAATGDGQRKAKPTKFNDLAGTLGLELDDLYKLEISSGTDGKPITVEYLKDLHSKQEDFVLRELQFEERRQQQEGELIRAQNELRDIMAQLPEKAIKPEVLERVRKKHDDVRALERTRTLEMIPDWRDDTRRAEDIKGMVEHLKAYGFPENFLDTAFSARMVKYVRDNWMREQRIRKALDLVTSGKPNPTTTATATGKAPKKPAATTSKAQGRNRLETLFSGVK